MPQVRLAGLEGRTTGALKRVQEFGNSGYAPNSRVMLSSVVSVRPALGFPPPLRAVSKLPKPPAGVQRKSMCNLYSMTNGRAAIIAMTRAMRDATGNMPQLPGIFPGADRAECAGWCVRTRHGALGHARATAVWRRAYHQQSQYEKSALATLADFGLSLRGALVLVLRICGHQGGKRRRDLRSMRADRSHFRRHLDGVGRTARHQGQSGRRQAHAVRILDNRPKQHRGTNSSESDAGGSNDAGRGRAGSRCRANRLWRCRRPCWVGRSKSWHKARSRMELPHDQRTTGGQCTDHLTWRRRPQRALVRDRGCKAWGSFGYAIKTGTRWLCGEHRYKRFKR